jgi:hypothetical protein
MINKFIVIKWRKKDEKSTFMVNLSLKNPKYVKIKIGNDDFVQRMIMLETKQISPRTDIQRDIQAIYENVHAINLITKILIKEAGKLDKKNTIQSD